jgi:tRNA pseudouridine32 synthase/23S rRNA pseudouridine746 synthase
VAGQEEIQEAPAGGGPRLLLLDEAVLAVDKPAGRLVIPGRVAGEPSLREELETRHGPLWVVHRLDRGTSGVLLFARTAAAHRHLNLQFERGEPRKAYLALVTGRPPDLFERDEGVAPARKGRMKPVPPGDPRGKPARTAFRVLERFERPDRPLALVEARPESGRTHQIRVHLLAAGCPLAIDPDYGEAGPLLDREGRPLLDRTPLHASWLALGHPADGRALVVEAPLPADLATALAALRRESGGDGGGGAAKVQAGR